MNLSASSSRSFKQLCKVHPSVMERGLTETVHTLESLLEDKVDAATFFETTYVTQGMREFLRVAFERLQGTGNQPVVLLAQAMGGGKTHNLIAAGLLAKKPSLRKKYLPSGIEVGEDLPPARVVGFTGRDNVPFWHALAEQLGQPEAFRSLGHDIAPGLSDWKRLLGRDTPTLIFLDELPPYFMMAAARKTTNHGTFADLVTYGLSNLLNAAAELPKVCVVVTDLAAQAFEQGSQAMNAALDIAMRALKDSSAEISRLGLRVSPVDLDSNEFFEILRKRIFLELPDAETIREIALEYQAALNTGSKSGLLAKETDGRFQQEIQAAYPFHPSWKMLYARVKDNEGLQQTRGLIRLIRAEVAALLADETEAPTLIGPMHLDARDPAVQRELDAINRDMESVRITDVMSSTGKQPTAAQVDEKHNTGKLAQRMAMHLFFSSMSRSVGQLRGLRAQEMLRDIVEPGQDLAKANEVLLRDNGLVRLCQYLHVIKTEERLLFKTIENPRAAVRALGAGYSKETLYKHLEKYLKTVFEPTTRTCYQEVLVFPDAPTLRLEHDRTKLVITLAETGLAQELEETFAKSEFKNRVLFLTNGQDYGTLESSARAYFAARAKDEEKSREKDPQLEEYRELVAEYEAALHQTICVTFTRLSHPSRETPGTGRRLKEVDFELRLKANAYNGEGQIIEALKGRNKFIETASDQALLDKVEERLFKTKLIRWAELLREAARQSDFYLTPPGLLEELKTGQVRCGNWKEHSATGEVEKGPFPVEPTSVLVHQVARNSASGEMTLEVKPLNGDTVYYAESGNVTEQSRILQAGEKLKTTALYVEFLCVDSRGAHPRGEVKTHRNSLDVRFEKVTAPEGPALCIFCVPRFENIRFTTDGSHPETSGQTYTAPLPLSGLKPGTKVQAYAVGSTGPLSEVALYELGKGIDPDKPVSYTNLNYSASSTQQSFSLVRLLADRRGSASARIILGDGDDFLSLDCAKNLPGAVLEGLISSLQTAHGDPSAPLVVDVQDVRFESGRDFADFCTTLAISYDAEQAKQKA